MQDIISITVILFLVMDPLGNLPIFISILKKFTPKKQLFIVIREMLIALLLMITFVFFGKYVFNFLGLKTETISIAGSIILFLISINMLFPNFNKNTHINKTHQEEPFILPLATPLVAGPSVLSNLIVLSKNYSNHLSKIVFSLFLAWILSTLILASSNIFFKIIGYKGVDALERLMGLVLIIIAVQMFLDGIHDYYFILFKI